MHVLKYVVLMLLTNCPLYFRPDDYNRSPISIQKIIKYYVLFYIAFNWL